MTSAEPHLELRLRLPCLATRTPAAGDDERGGGGDVERSARVAAGAAGVNQRVPPGAADRERGIFVQRATVPPPPEWPRRSPQSLPPFRPSCAERPAGPQSGRRGAAGEDFRHDRARFFAGERFVLVGNALQGVGDHRGPWTTIRVASFPHARSAWSRVNHEGHQGSRRKIL